MRRRARRAEPLEGAAELCRLEREDAERPERAEEREEPPPDERREERLLERVRARGARERRRGGARGEREERRREQGETRAQWREREQEQQRDPLVGARALEDAPRERTERLLGQDPSEGVRQPSRGTLRETGPSADAGHPLRAPPSAERRQRQSADARAR